MRKIPFLLLAAVLLSVTSPAQEFYVRAAAAYAFALPGQTMDGFGFLNGTITMTNISGLGISTTEYKLKTASFSAGLHGLLAGGYMI